MNPSWVPMRWPCGPLEIAQRKSLAAETRETLEYWLAPPALEILKGTPVNCLLVNWAGGLAQDSAQQAALAPLIARGRDSGLSFVGWIGESADPRAAIVRAAEAGLAAVATQDFKGELSFPVLRFPKRSRMEWMAGGAVLGVSENVWPGIQGRNASTAGATGIPWLDSNGWFLRLARARTRAEAVWLLFDPPGASQVVSEESYLLAVADSEAHGGRWVLSLDDRFRQEISRKTARAIEGWRRLAKTVAFFEEHRAWKAFGPLGRVAVISDFEVPNEFAAGEVLNLLARRQLPFRVIEKAAAEDAPLAGLLAIIYVDEQPPRPALRKKIISFVEQGGTLVTGPAWGPRPGGPPEPHPRFHVSKLGKGRLALAKEKTLDPYLVAGDTHILMSHANDLVRIHNAATLMSYYSADAGGRRAMLHLVNYSARPSSSLATVWLRTPYRSARLWSLETEAPVAVRTAPEAHGTEYYLPRFATYAGMELET